MRRDEKKERPGYDPTPFQSLCAPTREYGVV
jgi:hypothetical protein